MSGTRNYDAGPCGVTGLVMCLRAGLFDGVARDCYAFGEASPDPCTKYPQRDLET